MPIDKQHSNKHHLIGATIGATTVIVIAIVVIVIGIKAHWA